MSALILLTPASAGAITLSDGDVRRFGETWALEAEACRGGVGHDPDALIHCGKREAYAEILIFAGYCFDETTNEWRDGETIPDEDDSSKNARSIANVSCQ